MASRALPISTFEDQKLNIQHVWRHVPAKVAPFQSELHKFHYKIPTRSIAVASESYVLSSHKKIQL